MLRRQLVSNRFVSQPSSSASSSSLLWALPLLSMPWRFPSTTTTTSSSSEAAAGAQPDAGGKPPKQQLKQTQLDLTSFITSQSTFPGSAAAGRKTSSSSSPSSSSSSSSPSSASAAEPAKEQPSTAAAKTQQPQPKQKVQQKETAAAAAAEKEKKQQQSQPPPAAAPKEKENKSSTTPASEGKTATTSSKKKIRVGVLQPHAEGTWTDDSVRCSPEIYASVSDRLKRRFSFSEHTIRKNSAYRQLRQLTSESAFDVVWNMCDGARDEVRTGEDTLRVLESLKIGFTGADSSVFEPSKIDMKMLLAAAGIRTPNFAVLDRSDIEGAANSSSSSSSSSVESSVASTCSHLRFPVIVKHISGYGSIGITKDSKCENMQKLTKKLKSFVKEFDVALVEEFITGEEGTVFVCGDPTAPTGVHVFPPLMIPIPAGSGDFLHYGNKWKSSMLEDEYFNFFLRPDGGQLLPNEAEAMAKFKRAQRKRNKLVKEREQQEQQQQQQQQKKGESPKVTGGKPPLVDLPPAPTPPSFILSDDERAAIYRKVQRMAANAFTHIMQRVGYGRCDFRIDDVTHEPYFLEINPNCGIFLPDKATGKPKVGEGDYADLMIAEDKDWGHERFIATQLEVAMQQNAARTPWWNHSYSAAQRSFVTKAARAVPKYARVFGDEIRPVPVVARALFDILSPAAAGAAASNGGSAGNNGSSSSSSSSLVLNSHKNVAFLEGATGATSSSSSNGSSKSASSAREEEEDDDGDDDDNNDAGGVEDDAKRAAAAAKNYKKIKVGCAVFRGDGLQSCVLLQHSCDPNCALVHSNTIELAAVKPLKKGEPLSIDYSTVRDAAMPAFRCRCGEPKCRKWIFSQSVVVRKHSSSSSAAAAASMAGNSSKTSSSKQVETSSSSSSSTKEQNSDGKSAGKKKTTLQKASKTGISLRKKLRLLKRTQQKKAEQAAVAAATKKNNTKLSSSEDDELRQELEDQDVIKTKITAVSLSSISAVPEKKSSMSNGAKNNNNIGSSSSSSSVSPSAPEDVVSPPPLKCSSSSSSGGKPLSKKAVKRLSAMAHSPLNQKAVGLVSVQPDPEDVDSVLAGATRRAENDRGGYAAGLSNGDGGDLADQQQQGEQDDVGENEQDAHASDERTETLAREIARKTRLILEQRAKVLGKRKEERKRREKNAKKGGGGGDGGEKSEQKHSSSSSTGGNTNSGSSAGANQQVATNTNEVVASAIKQKLMESRMKLIEEMVGEEEESAPAAAAAAADADTADTTTTADADQDAKK